MQGPGTAESHGQSDGRHRELVKSVSIAYRPSRNALSAAASDVADRERLLEFGALIHQLNRLSIRSRRVMPLELPTGNHPATSLEAHSNEIGLNRTVPFVAGIGVIGESPAGDVSVEEDDGETGRALQLSRREAFRFDREEQ